MLADTGIVEARSKTEAEALAKKKFPGRKIEVSRIG